MPLPAAHLVHDSNGHGQLSSGPTLSEARDAYIKLKGVGKDKTFIRGASRNVCLSPVKLCHNLIDTEDQNYGPQTSLRRGHIEAVA